MTIEENKTIVQNLFIEIFHRGNLAVTDEFIAPDIIYHCFPDTFPVGPAGFRLLYTMLCRSFPDQHIELNDIIAENDKVVVRTTFKGTHTGPLMGFPPTGKRCTQSQISIFRLANGKISEYWFNADDLGMMRQLGLLAAPKNSSDL